MPFLEIRFPTNISYGAIGGQGWSTRVVTTDAGQEFRQQQFSKTRGNWHVGHNLRSATEWAALVSFHRLAKGRTNGFRFQDWTDYQADYSHGVVLPNVNGTLVLYKKYFQVDLLNGALVHTDYRIITKPQPDAPGVTFKRSGVLTGLATLDYTNGKVTIPDGDDPALYTWSGGFDVPARFDVDEPQLSFDIPTAVGWRGIPIVEIRVMDP